MSGFKQDFTRIVGEWTSESESVSEEEWTGPQRAMEAESWNGEPK